MYMFHSTNVLSIISATCSTTKMFLLMTWQALLSGCSAGGLATLIHCDDFRDVLPMDAKVKCLSDAGFFLNEYVFWRMHTPC